MMGRDKCALVNKVKDEFTYFKDHYGEKYALNLKDIKIKIQSLNNRLTPNRLLIIKIVLIYFGMLDLCYYVDDADEGLKILSQNIAKFLKANDSSYYQVLIRKMFKAYLYLLQYRNKQAEENLKEIRKLVACGRDTEIKEIMMERVTDLETIFDIIGR